MRVEGLLLTLALTIQCSGWTESQNLVDYGDEDEDSDQPPSMNKKTLSASAPYWTRPDLMDRVLHAEPLNNQVKLKCPASGNPTPEIRWFKNQVLIDYVTRHGQPKPYMQRPNRWQLIIPGLTYADEGNYTCVVRNQHGSLSHTVIVEALSPMVAKPILIDKSVNQTVMEGMAVGLFCNFMSDLATITHWLRPPASPDGGPALQFNEMTDVDKFQVIFNKDGRPFLGEKMSIQKAKISDSGAYLCIGRTNAGFTSSTVYLEVLPAEAVVLERPENLTVASGGSSYFTCKTPSTLRPYMSWVRLTRTDIVELSSGSEVLRLDNVTKEDEGPYACVVGTDSVHVQYVAYLRVAESWPRVSSSSHSTHLHAFFIVIACFAVIMLVLAVLIWKKLRRDRRVKEHAIIDAYTLTKWTKKIIIERQMSDQSILSPPLVRIEMHKSMLLNELNLPVSSSSDYELPLDPQWEFSRCQLKLGQILGEGAFGKVVKGEIFHAAKNGDALTTVVAVKMLKDQHSDQDLIDLVSETDMMKQIGSHANIINLLGTCTQDGPMLVIVEFAEHGNLRDFLRRFTAISLAKDYEAPMGSISQSMLYSIIRQVCKGMEYLHQKRCIHRDLAARNVLIAKNFVAKIADFGLARDLSKREYYHKIGDGFLPVRWMAPESLFQRKYSNSSDVWSFGILVWEVMSLGCGPYPNLMSVEKLIVLLQNGYRMDRPDGCSDEMYSVMRQCWHADPNRRPSFVALSEELNRISTFASDSVQLLKSEDKLRLPTSPTLIPNGVSNVTYAQLDPSTWEHSSYSTFKPDSVISSSASYSSNKQNSKPDSSEHFVTSSHF